MSEVAKPKMGGNERSWRRMMRALKLRDVDLGEATQQQMARASLARNGMELARLLDGDLEPKDRVASVRELRQLTEKLMEMATGGSETRGADDVGEEDDWDTPVAG